MKTKHQRYYQNMYATYSKNRLTVGADANFGLQEHSLKSDTSKTAAVYGGLVVVKYQALKKVCGYGRVEYFSDPNQVLTQKLDAGRYIKGTTLGVELHPQKTSFLSFEWRILESDKLIFRQGNTMLNQRNEFIVCLDLWF